MADEAHDPDPLTCPVCGRSVDDQEEIPIDRDVTVWCCQRCRTGVLRTFAHHRAAS